jgi:hypothetical protein
VAGICVGPPREAGARNGALIAASRLRLLPGQHRLGGVLRNLAGTEDVVRSTHYRYGGANDQLLDEYPALQGVSFLVR